MHKNRPESSLARLHVGARLVGLLSQLWQRLLLLCRFFRQDLQRPGAKFRKYEKIHFFPRNPTYGNRNISQPPFNPLVFSKSFIIAGIASSCANAACRRSRLTTRSTFAVKFAKKSNSTPVVGMWPEWSRNAETLLIVLLSLFAQEIHVGFQQSDIFPANFDPEISQTSTSMNSIQLPSSGCLLYPQDMDQFYHVLSVFQDVFRARKNKDPDQTRLCCCMSQRLGEVKTSELFFLKDLRFHRFFLES